MGQLGRRSGLILLAFFSLLTMTLAMFPVPKALAAGETYTWKDQNTISVGGGNLKKGEDLKLIPGSNPRRFDDQTGTLPVDKSGCSVNITLTLTSDNTGTTKAPLPIPNAPPSWGQTGVSYCDMWNAKKNQPVYPGVSASYNNEQVTIIGTPANGTSETPLQKQVLVLIHAPNVATQEPATINVWVKDASGKTIQTIAAQQEPAAGNGSADPTSGTYVPPDVRSVDFPATFTLEPGSYTVCADIVIQSCKNFTKVKFQDLTLEYGETADQRSIDITVKITDIGGLEATTYGPLAVTVMRPSQVTDNLRTNSVTTQLNGILQGGQGVMATTTIQLTATDPNLDPGTYNVCLVMTGDCKQVKKDPGAVANVEFDMDWNAVNPAAAANDTQCKDKYDVMGVKAVTYLICSIIGTATFAVGQMDNVITSMLTLDTKDLFGTAGTQNNFHTAWNSFRYISLGLIVVAALVMVLAQAMGWEMFDAYTIRKLLPRLLFAAVFISLSWNLIEFFAQMSNDIGTGMRTLIYAPFAAMAQKDSLGGGSTFVFALIGTGGALALGWIGLLSFVVTGLLATLVALAVLIFRKMAFLLLLMFAPFAIACYVLPGTRKIWDFWQDSLTAVLIVFPIIEGFIAIGRVVSVTSFNAPTNLPGGQTVNQLIAVIAYFAPYFLISMAFKMAGGLMHLAHNAVNGRSQGAFGRLKEFRAGKTSQNLNKMKAGNRFSDRNMFTRGFNNATIGMGTGKGRPFNRGRRNEKIDQLLRGQSAEIMDSAAFRNLHEDVGALEAATYGSRRAAIAGLMARGQSREEASRAAAAVETSIGFGRAQQIAAAQQMVSNGRAYGDVEHMAQTLARAANGNVSTAASLSGFANWEAKNKGRHDLAPSFGGLFEAVQREAGMTQGFSDDPTIAAQEREQFYRGDDGVIEKSWNSADPMTLVRDKGPGFQNFMNHWEKQYTQAHAEIAAANADYQAASVSRNVQAMMRADQRRAAAIKRATKSERAIYEVETSMPYAAGDIADRITATTGRLKNIRKDFADTNFTGSAGSLSSDQARVGYNRGDDRNAQPATLPPTPTGRQDPNQHYQSTELNFFDLAHRGARIARPRDINLE